MSRTSPVTVIIAAALGHVHATLVGGLRGERKGDGGAQNNEESDEFLHRIHVVEGYP